MELAQTYRIETERLVIRCYEPGDEHMMQAAITGSIPHLRPWIPWARQEPRDLDWMIGFIRLFRGQFDLGQDAVYAIFNRTETEQIGGTGLHNRVGKDAREIGYWINVKHINKGYATEAVRALIKVGFGVEKLARLEIRCDPENVFSRRIPQRLGFRHEMTLRNNSTDGDGRLSDLMIWALNKREYDGAEDIALRAYDFTGKIISF